MLLKVSNCGWEPSDAKKKNQLCALAKICAVKRLRPFGSAECFISSSPFLMQYTIKILYVKNLNLSVEIHDKIKTHAFNSEYWFFNVIFYQCCCNNITFIYFIPVLSVLPVIYLKQSNKNCVIFSVHHISF